jgi:Lon-like ATP-dependent protease
MQTNTERNDGPSGGGGSPPIPPDEWDEWAVDPDAVDGETGRDRSEAPGDAETDDEGDLVPVGATATAPVAAEDALEDDLLGGLDVGTTAEIEVPERLIDQVIGQDVARDVIQKAAEQRRHVMMIGSPGTGKSMLAKAMAELLPNEELQDVLVYHNPDDGNEPKVRTVPAGKGEQIVAAHREEAAKKGRVRSLLMWVAVLGVLAYGLFTGNLLLGLLAAGVVYFVFRAGRRRTRATVPKLLIDNAGRTTAPFEDATGAHAGALLGDVRHDPYQSGGMETPSHDRVEAGAIHKANRGVLFVDEINTMGIRSQQHLMTAIQEGAFAITGQSERSSGAMVKTEPVPTDFVMIAAGNLDAVENMHPALRSRIKGYGYEVYMDDTVADTPELRRKYARFVAQEVAKDGRLPHFTSGAIEEVLLEARRRAGRKGHLTLELRNLGGLVRVAGDLARGEGAELTTRGHVLRAKRKARSIEQQIADDYIERRKEYDLSLTTGGRVGRVNGLAVMGEDSGVVMPVMAEVTPAQGPGEVIATGKLQEIAEEAVQNVSAVVKKYSRVDLAALDVHIQFVGAGGGGVDGDSASVTVATAVVSALEGLEVDQSVAMTGSLSVRGDVLPVGGVTHKIEAAAKAGMSRVIIPRANLQDVMVEDEYRELVEVIPVDHITDVLDVALVEDDAEAKSTLLRRLKEVTGSVLESGPGGHGGRSGIGSPSPR